MPKDVRPQTLRLKRGDIRVRTRGDLTAVVWKDKRVSWTTTQKKDYNTSFRPSSMQRVEASITMQVKEHVYLQGFFRNFIFYITQ